MHRRSNEPLVWLPSILLGGGIAAMFAPALMLVTGIAMPLGAGSRLESYSQTLSLINLVPVRLFLLAFISLSLFHSAHRFRFTLLDLGVH